MSKLKENRMKYFKIYKSKRDRAEQVIDNNPNNLRLLQTAKTNLDKSWDDYSSSHFDFIVKEADEEGMADFEAEHDDLTSKNDEVVVLLEEKIDLLQTPEVVPVVVLSAAQKSEKKKNQGILLQKNLVSFANMVEEEAKKDISKETAQMLMDEVKSSKKEVSKVKEAFDEAINLNPSAFNELEANCNQIIKELDEKFNNLVIALFPKTAETSPPSSSSTISSASSAPVTYKEYAKERIPTFDGSVRNYAQFKDEWKTCVIPGRDEKWCLIALNKHTPKQVDLRNVESVEEAWRERPIG